MNYSIQKIRKAYFDSFSGLVPVVPIRMIESTEIRATYLKIKVLADFRAYKEGEILVVHSDKVVPEKQIRHREFGSTILTNFTWSDSEKEVVPFCRTLI